MDNKTLGNGRRALSQTHRAIAWAGSIFHGEHSVYRAQSQWISAVGAVGLAGFALLEFSLVRWANFFEGLMLIAFAIAMFKAPARVKNDPLVLFVISALLLSITGFVLSNVQYPLYAEDYPRLDRLSKLFLIFVVAWWLGGRLENTLRLYALAFLGLILGILYHFDLNAILEGLRPGGRVDFGLRNAGHSAALLGTALLGWLFLVRYFMGNSSGWFFWGKAVLWIVVALFLSWGVFVSETRAAWLGLTISASSSAIAVLVLLVRRPRSRSTPGGPVAVLGMLALVSIIGIGLAYHDRIEQRMAQEKESIIQIYAGNPEQLPFDGVGVRLHQWAEAWRWIQQRPLTGWGERGRSAVIDDSPRFSDEFKQQFGHFHNSVVEILLINGSLGLATVIALIGWIYVALYRAWKSGRLPTDIFLFGCAFFIFWSIVNMFESYLVFWTGTYVNAIVGGGLYSFYLRSKQQVA